MTHICPKCNEENQRRILEGLILRSRERGVEVPKREASVMMKPHRGEDGFPVVWAFHGLTMYPYVCPKCGYVELWRELE